MAHISTPVTDVAYFSMEMMLETDIPTYSGGLGVLAGDILRSCADLGVNAVGVSLVYSGGTFKQHIHADGTQTFIDVPWSKIDQLTKLTQRITLTIREEEIQVAVWRYDIVGLSGSVVPIYLLDTDLPENSPWGREITRNLYADRGDLRISQEIVLGIGGVKMLRHLGYSHIRSFHMNEGHCAFVPLALHEEFEYQDEPVRKLCTFTTHTPIPEGHDVFEYDFAYQYAQKYLPWHIRDIAGQDKLHMTRLASNMSSYTCGVSEKHERVAQHIFPDLTFHHITNGVHHRTWIHPLLQDLYERYIPGSLEDPGKLKTFSETLPSDKLWDTHQACKLELMSYINAHNQTTQSRNHDMFDCDTLTIALGRRPVAYKRPLLLYHDIERLLALGDGKLQIIQCGKSHPNDTASQEIVKKILEISKALKGRIRIVYLENYSPYIARMLVSGADVWLNTPMQPLEASGTSGMKASMNGLLNLSVPDGWWLEGMRIEPESGFAIGDEITGLEAAFDDSADSNALYTQIEKSLIPLYYENKEEWSRRMKRAIALGGYFNTHRCVREYKKYAWEKHA